MTTDERDHEIRKQHKATGSSALPICSSCDEHHPPECMCPPHEVRSPGHKNCRVCKAAGGEGK